MYIKEQYRKPKAFSSHVLASPGGANVVSTTTILNNGSLYRIACSGAEIFVNPTTETMVAANKNGIYLAVAQEFYFVADTTRLQTLSTGGAGLFQLTEFET